MIGLDLFSCSGCASIGYTRARFTMLGNDLDPQPNYPGPFRQFDALGTLRGLIAGDALMFRGHGRVTLEDVAFAHASPPCQGYTTLAAVHGNNWPMLIDETRELLDGSGLPYVIENVAGARKHMRNPITLCGEMFGLGVIRHRLFESNMLLTAPAHKPHRGKVRGWRHGEYFDGPYLAVYGEGGGKGTVTEWQEAMGITHTDNRHEIAEAIPPAYTEHLGRQIAALVAPQHDAKAA